MPRRILTSSAGTRTGAINHNPLSVAFMAALLAFTGGLTGCDDATSQLAPPGAAGGHPDDPHNVPPDGVNETDLEGQECPAQQGAPFWTFTANYDQFGQRTGAYTVIKCGPNQVAIPLEMLNIAFGHLANPDDLSDPSNQVPMIDEVRGILCESGMRPQEDDTVYTIIPQAGVVHELPATVEGLDFMHRLVLQVAPNTNLVLYDINDGQQMRRIAVVRDADDLDHLVHIVDEHGPVDGDKHVRHMILVGDPVEENGYSQIDWHMGSMHGLRFGLDAAFVPEWQDIGAQSPFRYDQGFASSGLQFPSFAPGTSATLGIENSPGIGEIHVLINGTRPSAQPITLHQVRDPAACEDALNEARAAAQE